MIHFDPKSPEADASGDFCLTRREIYQRKTPTAEKKFFGEGLEEIRIKSWFKTKNINFLQNKFEIKSKKQKICVYY